LALLSRDVARSLGGEHRLTPASSVRRFVRCRAIPGCAFRLCTGADKGVLDPLGADLDAGPDQYFLLMRNLADALADCLGAAKSG
jgi:hypothetical protein